MAEGQSQFGVGLYFFDPAGQIALSDGGLGFRSADAKKTALGSWLP